MDILGSIMKKMEKPPCLLGEKERQQKKLQQEMLKKEQEAKEKRIREFREKMSDEIKKFVEDETKTRHTFQPMDKAYRSMLYTIAEDAGLTVHSFGREEEDRHVMIFKEGDAPCEAEIIALRRREMFLPPSSEPVDESEGCSDESERVIHKARRKGNAPPPEYLQKYQKHLGGLQSAKDAAIKTQADNRSYGFVSSEQKRDKRTIEETLADIRARKKQKPDDS